MRHCGHRGRFERIPAAILAMNWGGRGWDGFGASFGRDAGDWGGGGRARRGRRRMFESGELRLVLLRLIAEQARHGYDLIRAIQELTAGEYSPSPGVVYPTLTMLQDMGLIEEVVSEGARKAFSVTAEGTSHLESKADEVDALLARLKEIGEPQRRAHGGPVKRAVANLMSALWHRVARDDADEERLHAIAAILDEAAQKIERVR